MTTERKIVFSPSDVERIEFTCKNCGAILALSPSNDKHHIQRDCPNCGNEWMSQESVLHHAATNLLKSLRTLAEMDKEAKSKVRLCLRSDEPKSV
jgi:predicted  nucleic acid-binding Zn-ribbon protein